MKIKELTVLAMLSTILIILKVALAGLPNIELITLLIMLYTLHFGRKVLYIIYVFVFIEMCIYGPGIWTINYLYIWTLLALLVWLFRDKKELMFWAFVAGFFGLFFGALTALPYLFIGGFPLALAYWVQGLLYDVIHFAGNFVSVLILFRPLDKALLYLRQEFLES